VSMQSSTERCGISPSNADFGVEGFLKFLPREKSMLSWWDADS
jgi:hypothetical protein